VLLMKLLSTLKSQFIALTTLMIVLATLVCGLALVGMAACVDMLERSYQDHLVPSQIVGRMLILANENRTQLMLALQHGPNNSFRQLHQHSMESHLDEINRNRQRMDDLVVQIQHLPLSNESKTLLDTYLNKRERYRNSASNPTADSLRNGNYELANLLLLTKVNPELSALGKVGEDMLTSVQADALRDNQEATQRYQEMKLFLVSFIVTAVLLTIYLGWRLTRRIFAQIGCEPVHAVGVAKRIAAGDLVSDYGLAPNDRSSMMAAFQCMAQSIQQLIMDIEGMTAQRDAGQGSVRLDESKFGGSFQVLVAAFNRMVGGMNELISHANEMRCQAALQEQKFRTLAENSPDIIARYDLEGRLVYANTAYLIEMEVSPEEVFGQTTVPATAWRPCILQEDYRSVLQQVIQTGNPDRVHWQWSGDDKQIVSHELSIVAEHDNGGRVMGALAIGRNVSERHQFEEKLLYQAHHDPLTGLPNRVLLKDRMRQAILRSGRDDERLGVIFIDLDNFKQINDGLGHDMGDELLRLIAGRMSDVLHECDTVARLGGDEFVILLEHVEGKRDIGVVVPKLIQSISQSCHLGCHRVYPGASIGISVFPEDGIDIETLMRHADMAMYVAKNDPINRYRYFSSEMNEEIRQWMEISSRLRFAVENNELSLHYQPKVSIAGENVIGLEALIRWHDRELGWIPPSRFIPLAEKYGMIDQIGSWVLNEVCRQVRQWKDSGFRPPRVAVNISSSQRQGVELVNQIVEVLGKHGLSGECLEVEITESIVMSDAEESIQAFWSLRDAGIEIAVDDFGTGYSSLSYLKRLPVDTLKIDKSFVDDIEHDQNAFEIVRAITAMGHCLNLTVIAEGVESAAQVELLRQVDCDQIQGYWYSPPVPPTQLASVFDHLGSPGFDVAAEGSQTSLFSSEGKERRRTGAFAYRGRR
jgi:diguanylate cyclase (GGDEF)-like protein/PAS domain S-box-containing protein